MSKFIVCTSNATAEQQNAITRLLASKDVGYWHWIADTWIVKDSTDSLKASSLRDEIRAVSNGCSVLVMKAEVNTWAGYGKKNMFKWLRENL